MKHPTNANAVRGNGVSGKQKTNQPPHYTNPVSDNQYNPEAIRADQIAEARQRVAEEDRQAAACAINLRNRMRLIGSSDTALAVAFRDALKMTGGAI